MGSSCSQTPNSGRVSVKHFKMHDEERARLVVANFLVLESFVLTTVYVGQATVVLETSNKTNVTLYSATFCLYMMDKRYTFKDQTLENEHPVYFKL